MQPGRVALALVLAGCAPSMGAQNRSEPELEAAQSATANADLAIDASRCTEGRGRLQPFVVSWDTTDLAELAAHSQHALALVKLDGCSLELLPGCVIPGEYRLRKTTGSEQSLVVSSRDELYAKLPLSVAQLGGELQSDRALTLRYYVRGLRYATAPVLYRSQLAPGCGQATHFVLNYATGAYELDVARGGSQAASAGVLGTGAGARRREGRRVVFKGGEISSCPRAEQCDAPIRLRLLPVLDGDPPADTAEAASRAVTKPGLGESVVETRSRESIQQTVRAAYPAFRACYRDLLGRLPEVAVTAEAHFTVEPDGVVSQLDLVMKGPSDTAFTECFRDVLYGARFEPAQRTSTVVYPLQFEP